MLVQFSKSARRLMTLALVAMMMASGLIAPASTAAQSQTIQSSLTGVNIGYGPPYELQEDGRFADETMETMMFLGSADILAMGFMTPLIDLNGARDILLEALFGETGSAATIDRGDYTGVSYSLDMLNIEGQEMGVFSLFMNQRSHGYSEFYIFLAPPALFGATMQTAQNSFTVDGTPIMDGVDSTAMGNMVTANIGITGGTAVTDVTEVTEATDPGPGTETVETGTETEHTDITEDIDQAERLVYLIGVTFEFGAVDGSIGTIFDLLGQLDSGASDAQTVRPLIDEEYAYLAGTRDRVAAIEVPAGMEPFHQEVLIWSDAITLAGTTWFDFVEGRTTSEAATGAMMDAIDVHLAFSDKLQAENMAITTGTESTGTTETTETTENTGTTRSTRTSGTSETPETTQTGTSSTDAAAYIEAIQDHRFAFFESLSVWNENMDLINENATDADIQTAREGTLAEAEYWVEFTANAQQLTPPSGYEDVHEAYLIWAAEITELGNLWVGGLNQDADMLDQFFDQLPVVQEADDNLQSAITSAGQQDTGSETSTEGTETTSGSSRSSRSTSSTGETSETTETSSRPDRNTRGGSQTDTSGNTSETSGRSGSSSLPNEWYMEANDVTISWSDDFALSVSASEPQITDVQAGEDKIYLDGTSARGNAIEFNITVYDNDDADSTGLINAVLNDVNAAESTFGVGSEIVDSEVGAEASAVLVRATDEIGEFFIYAQVTCVTSNCDTVSVLLIAVEGDVLVKVLGDMENGVVIDGTAVSSAIPISDIENAVNQFGN